MQYTNDDQLKHLDLLPSDTEKAFSGVKLIKTLVKNALGFKVGK